MPDTGGIPGLCFFGRRCTSRFFYFYTGNCAEYHNREYHTVINESSRESGKGVAEKEQALHMDVVYRRKKVKVHLEFQEEQSDQNAQMFYGSLKKLYLEKGGIRAMVPGQPTLRYKI